MTYLTLINKQTKDTSSEYLKHYEMVERIMKPLANSYALGAATKLSQKYLMDHKQYPILSFAHEDGIAHIMLDDGMGTGNDAFLDDILNMLIDKGEFIEQTAPEQLLKYYDLMKQLKDLKIEMKTYLKDKYKKNRGKDKRQW